MDRYVVVSQTIWDSAVSRTGKWSPGLPTTPLLTLDEVGKAATGLAKARGEPYYVVKLVPVQMHNARTEVTVDLL